MSREKNLFIVHWQGDSLISKLSITPASCLEFVTGNATEVKTEIKKAGVFVHVDRKRHCEEVELLKKDMKNFLLYYMNLQEQLQTIIDEEPKVYISPFAIVMAVTSARCLIYPSLNVHITLYIYNSPG